VAATAASLLLLLLLLLLMLLLCYTPTTCHGGGAVLGLLSYGLMGNMMLVTFTLLGLPPQRQMCRMWHSQELAASTCNRH
jgi:hypothetical protein